MAAKSFISDELHSYVRSVSLREAGLLRKLREETAAHPRAIMQVPPEQGQLLALLVQATGAKKCLEIGVFTGYSSLSVALALPADGKIVACDVSEEFTSVARRYWAEAGVSDKIDLRIGPALDTLRDLFHSGAAGTFDFAFIDADKPSYPEYFELSLQLVRRGGLIVVDNVLQRGLVADAANTEENVVVMREFNRELCGDERVSLSVLPFADGITLAVKR